MTETMSVAGNEASQTGRTPGRPTSPRHVSGAYTAAVTALLSRWKSWHLWDVLNGSQWLVHLGWGEGG